MKQYFLELFTLLLPFVVPSLYLASFLICYIIISTIMIRKKLNFEIVKDIVFHQINIYHDILWIPLNIIILIFFGGLPWIFFCSSVYLTTFIKGNHVQALCCTKKIRVNRNSFFRNTSKIVEIEYRFSGSKYKIKTKVPDSIFNYFYEGETVNILVQESFPGFWVLDFAGYVKKD